MKTTIRVIFAGSSTWHYARLHLPKTDGIDCKPIGTDTKSKMESVGCETVSFRF